MYKFKTFSTFFCIGAFLLSFTFNAVANPNPDATAVLDLVLDGGSGNHVDDGNRTATVSGKGTKIVVEVFVLGVVTELRNLGFSFFFDKSLVRLDSVSTNESYLREDPPLPFLWSSNGSENPPIPNNVALVNTPRDGPYVTVPPSGWVARLEFTTHSDVTDEVFTIVLLQMRIRVPGRSSDFISGHSPSMSHGPDTPPGPWSLRFNAGGPVISTPIGQTSQPPPPPSPLPSFLRKNILPGDLNGDGSVNTADFLILSDNFGKTGGDTFDPNNLVEASAGHSPVPVTITVYDTIVHHVQVPVPVENVPRPEIVVKPGKWGLSMSDLQTVLDDTRDAFADLLVYPLDSDITVEYKSPEGPKVLYNRANDGSYVVWLELFGEGYGQPIYQFAHEYGHILSNYRERSSYEQQLWFEESIADLASLFALKTLGTTWEAKSNINHRIHAPYIQEYYTDLTKGVSIPTNLGQWYANNKSQLNRNPYIRDKNRQVALALLDIFEQNPNEAWNAVRYMNRGPLRHNRDLSSYLNDWWRRTPKQWQFVVAKIMSKFGVSRIQGSFLSDSPHQHIEAY